MASQQLPPWPQGVEFDDDTVVQWFVVVQNVINNPITNSLSTDPGIANVPGGTWSVWKNTTTGTVKIWTNDGGTMKSVTLS